MIINAVVWIPDLKLYGTIKSHGAFVSLVNYTEGGIDYEVWIENDDLEIYEDDEDE